MRGFKCIGKWGQSILIKRMAGQVSLTRERDVSFSKLWTDYPVNTVVNMKQGMINWSSAKLVNDETGITA